MKTAPPPPPAITPPVADPDGLVFQWERRSWSRLRLVPMIFISLLVHAASFYVLQVAYTPTGSQLPPPAQVVLLRLDQPENAPLARWLAMTDPALLSRPAPPTVAQTMAALPFHYTPSYDTALPDFKALDSPGVNSALVSTPPRPHPLGPVPAHLLPPLATPAPVALTAVPEPGQTTRVQFSGEVAAFAPPLLPLVRFAAARGTKVMEPTVFLVGVRSSGGVPFLFRQPALFRQAAGGDVEAETFARDYLSRLPFRAPTASGEGEAVVWGWAIFSWGNDVYGGSGK